MNLRAAMDGVRAAWSDGHVRVVAQSFLDECKGILEVDDEEWIRVPADTELVVYSAAVIVSRFGFCDHIEAIVFLGADITPLGVFPVHGVLRLYLNAAGEMITEDRYTVARWHDKR